MAIYFETSAIVSWSSDAGEMLPEQILTTKESPANMLMVGRVVPDNVIV